MMMNGKIKQLTPSMMNTDRDQSQEKILPLEEQIPKEFHDFLDVFSEEKAACFPESRPWVRKIKLKDTFTPKSFKMYNLTP